MRDGWSVSDEPAPEHLAWANACGHLFATPGWAELLTRLDAQPLHAWHAGLGIGVVVPVFRRMGVRIGFLGFPISGPVFDAMSAGEVADCAAGIAAAARLDLVRVAQSQCMDGTAGCTSARPEAWIDNLQTWNLAEHKRLRKDIAYANRSATTTTLIERDFDAGACFELYASAVLRHGGRVKYGATYFSALRDLAEKSPLLDFVVAVDGDRVCGFSVLAMDGGVGNYLHSAVDDAARRQGVSDLLLQKLVDKARDAGCERFSLMASPWEQSGLMRFKQKWACSLGLAVTRDCPRTLAGQVVTRATSWQGRGDRRMAATPRSRLHGGSSAKS